MRRNSVAVSFSNIHAANIEPDEHPDANANDGGLHMHLACPKNEPIADDEEGKEQQSAGHGAGTIVSLLKNQSRVSRAKRRRSQG
jgi:hypothetical protein